MFDSTVHRLNQYLSRYAAKYPMAWQYFEEFRAGRGRDLPAWPDWCWCPLAAAHAIITRGGQISSLDQAGDVGVLGALGAWRITKGIYRFDYDLFRELWWTPVEGSLPIEILYRLPEWCVYLEAPPGYRWHDAPLLGWFTHLEWDANRKSPELRFVIDLDRQEFPLVPMVIHLSADELTECVLRAAEVAQHEAARFGADFDFIAQAPTLALELAPLVSVTLYLCSAAADVVDRDNRRERPARPVPVKTKRGPRIFAASNPTTWLVGYRIGAALRFARREGGTGGEPAETGTWRQRRSPRPHIRRAHWHSYWIGPREGRREVVLRWLPPIPVGAGETVPTIHPVKK